MIGPLGPKGVLVSYCPFGTSVASHAHIALRYSAARESTASPRPIPVSRIQLGRLPWSYDQVWRVYQKAAKAAGIGALGTHSLRHTFCTWLDSVGTPIGVQQRLMRHADIRTTMNVYGDAVSADMAEAHSKIVGLAFNGTETARKPV